jgi:hypothetical protein
MISKQKRALDGASIHAKDQFDNRRNMPSHAQSARLLLPAGEPDIEALRSVTREWLVPRLVVKFLRLHGAQLKYSQNLASEASRLPRPLTGEGRTLSPTTAGHKETRRLENASRREKPIRSALVGGHGRS